MRTWPPLLAPGTTTGNQVSRPLGLRLQGIGPRQRKAVNALLDVGPGGFEGGMNTRKYENLTGAARATASRDLIELAALGLPTKVGAGRGTWYHLQIEGWAPA